MSKPDGEIRETARTHLERSLKLAEESKHIGVNTLIKLDGQGEQMKRISADAQDTEYIIKGNRGVVRDMRRNWIVRLCCYNRSDIVPDDVTWDRRDTPEEQERVRKMIKLDKRRRMLRRKKKADENAAADGKKPEEKKSSWKFWKKTQDDASEEDLSDISEGSEGEQAKESPPKPILPAPKLSKYLDSNASDSIVYPDEDTALDQLHGTVQDLKIVALQISETSKAQTATLAGISSQVNKNQDHLEKNNKLIGKLGRRAKDDGDNGMLSAQDRLAIMGVQSALTSKFNN
jgi:hypothetical protein